MRGVKRFSLDVRYFRRVTRAQKIELVNERRSLMRDVAEIDRTIRNIAISGTASASLSVGGGSKSYSRINLAELRALRNELAERLRGVSLRLAGRSPFAINHVMVTRG